MKLIFDSWVDSILKEGLPKEIQGFSFNLFEWHDEERGIELIGALTFDESDPETGLKKDVLRSARGLGIGFVDGEMEIIYRNK